MFLHWQPIRTDSQRFAFLHLLRRRMGWQPMRRNGWQSLLYWAHARLCSDGRTGNYVDPFRDLIASGGSYKFASMKVCNDVLLILLDSNMLMCLSTPRKCCASMPYSQRRCFAQRSNSSLVKLVRPFFATAESVLGRPPALCIRRRPSRRAPLV
eukprot:SAG31_NODE_1065_length_10096_cov_7.151530_8_plen_154_part_00